MKNYFLPFSLIIALATGCSGGSTAEVAALKSEIATLKASIEDLKPGLGEIMGVIQQHHAKLYYSGESENWELAAYQLDEIKEGLDQATELHEHFKDVKGSLKELRHITDSGIQNVQSSIEAKSKPAFLSAFKSLTVSCNQCHQAAEHGFIVIQIPTSPLFTNQKFTKTK